MDKKFLALSEGLFGNKDNTPSGPATDFSFVLKLHTIRFPNGAKAKEIPGIFEIHTKSDGKLFVKKYFLHYRNLKPRMIRFTSKDNTFRKIFTLDICNHRLDPIVGIPPKEDMPADKFIKTIAAIAEIKKLGKKQSFSFIDESVLYESDADAAKTVLMGNLLGALIGASIPMAFWLWFKFKQFKRWQIEQATYDAEDDINRKLFKGQKGNETAFNIYSKVERYLQQVIKGQTVALILCGPPGMSKTYTVKRTFHFAGLKPGKDYAVMRGATAEMIDIYQMLFDYREKILVLDDFDSPLGNPDVVNFLKSITDSYSRRIISMPRQREISSGQQSEVAIDVPQRFEFKGKLVIITNLLKSQIDAALLSRAPAVEVNFDQKQVIEALKDLIVYINPRVPMAEKKEVYDYVVYLYNKNPDINLDFRSFTHACDARVGDPEGWKDTVNIIMGVKNF